MLLAKPLEFVDDLKRFWRQAQPLLKPITLGSAVSVAHPQSARKSRLAPADSLSSQDPIHVEPPMPTPHEHDYTPPSDHTPPSLTRRRLLGSAAGAAAAAAAPDAAECPPRFGAGSGDARVAERHQARRPLMQENRSFDHYFGTMAGVRGFGDPNALKLPNGKSVFYQPDPVRTRAATCCRSTWTRARPARRKSRPPAMPGRCSTPPGTAARWTTGCRPIARPRATRRPTSWATTRGPTSPFSSRWPRRSRSATPTTAR